MRMCLTKSDGFANILSQLSHSYVLFLYDPFLKAVSSFRICSSISSSSSSGILKHNTRCSSRFNRSSLSSLSLATTTVFAFSARFGCGFFLRPVLLPLLMLLYYSCKVKFLIQKRHPNLHNKRVVYTLLFVV